MAYCFYLVEQMGDAINHRSSSFCAAMRNMMKNDTFKCALVAIQVFCFAGESVAQKEPSLRCEFIGPPDSSGVRIKASNPHVGSMFDPDHSRPWFCTVTCVYRTSDRTEFSSFTCTERVRDGADNEEICRQGPGLSGAPFREGVISNASCQ
jgi:hypothetical protein